VLLSDVYISQTHITVKFTMTPQNSHLTPAAPHAVQGTLPDCLFRMPRARLLYLDGNRITGTIPASVGRAAATLEQLYLQDNQLEGTAPQSLTLLGKLQRLYMHNNAGMIGSPEAIRMLEARFGESFRFSVNVSVPGRVVYALRVSACGRAVQCECVRGVP
jgi:hypothetical protein